VDSTGARALLHVHNKFESVGRRLVILSPTRPVWRVLRIMGLDQVMDVRPASNGAEAEEGAPDLEQRVRRATQFKS
jgi:anti-anti-sigma factor